MTASDSSRVAFRVISAGDYNCLQASNLAITYLLIFLSVLSESKFATPSNFKVFEIGRRVILASDLVCVV